MSQRQDNSKERNSSPEPVVRLAHHLGTTGSILSPILGIYTKQQLDILFATKRTNNRQLEQGMSTVIQILGYITSKNRSVFFYTPRTIGMHLLIHHSAVSKWLARMAKSGIITILERGKWRSQKPFKRRKSVSTKYFMPKMEELSNLIKDLIKIHKRHISSLESFQVPHSEADILVTLKVLFKHKKKIQPTLLELERDLGLDSYNEPLDF